MGLTEEFAIANQGRKEQAVRAGTEPGRGSKSGCFLEELGAGGSAEGQQ